MANRHWMTRQIEREQALLNDELALAVEEFDAAHWARSTDWPARIAGWVREIGERVSNSPSGT